MAKRRRLRNMTMAAAAAALISQYPAVVAEAAPPESGNWTLLPAASDEFDGTCLDEQKWTNGIWYDVTTDLAFHPDNVSVRDGNLVLAAKKEAYNGKNYTAAAVESKFEVPGTASYVEVRAKALDKKANVLSAIWMQSSPLNSALNPNPEIDIMETFDYTKMTSTLHTWHQNPLLPAASDEFDGTCLDEQKWTNGIWYDVTTDLAFHPDNVSVRDGNLVLAAKKEAYNGKNYTAAAVESKFEVPGTASYVEVRAKALDKKANVLSAIWMQSSPLNSALNPNPEIDIMETFDYTKMTSTLHTWHQNPSIHLQRGTKGWKTGLEDISADYHTYALERRDGKLRFYFDGQLTWEKTSIEDSFVELSRHMVLSLEGHLGTPAEEYLPGEFLVDYVRTYYDSDFAGVPADGNYQIVNRQSKKALDIPDAQAGGSAQLVQKDTASAGSWNLWKQADDTWTMTNAANGNCVDLTADTGVTSNGTAVVQYGYHGEANQKMVSGSDRWRGI